MATQSILIIIFIISAYFKPQSAFQIIVHSKLIGIVNMSSDRLLVSIIGYGLFALECFRLEEVVSGTLCFSWCLFPGEIRETNGQPGSNCFFSFAEFVSGGSWTCMHSGYIFCMHASFSIRGLAELVIDVLSEPIIVFQSVCNMLMPSLRCCRQMASLAPMCFLFVATFSSEDQNSFTWFAFAMFVVLLCFFCSRIFSGYM